MADVAMQPGIAKLEFAMGAHGLVWATGTTTVERVSCQARLLGVRPGWSISMINGVAANDSATCWHELLKCKKSGQKYNVYFTKDEASIRADQQKAEAERAKKMKDLEESRRQEETAKKIREDADKKRADELAAKKQEYWDKQEAKDAPADAGAGGEAAAEADAGGEAAEADAPEPAEEAPAGAGGEGAPAEEDTAPPPEGEEAPPADE